LLPVSNEELMAMQDPGVLSQGFLVDLIVSKRMASFWMDGMCTPETTANEIFNEITSATGHFANAPTGNPSVMGYFSPDEVVAECSKRHSAISLVSDYAIDLSFHSALAPITQLKQAPLLPVPTYNASKVYLAIVVSDGDNMQVRQHALLP